jgi:hypothetical protein
MLDASHGRGNNFLLMSLTAEAVHMEVISDADEMSIASRLADFFRHAEGSHGAVCIDMNGCLAGMVDLIHPDVRVGK